MYKIKLWPFQNSSKSAVRSSLFVTVKLIKNADSNKYSYSERGVSFDIRGTFSFKNGVLGRNVIISGADMSSSLHFDNKKRYLNSW